MRKRSHRNTNKLIFLVTSVLVFTFYLIYSYNQLKGQSYIFEPVYISLSGNVPDNTSLELHSQSINDPTITRTADLLTHDSIPENTYIFVIDSSYRLTNFSIYFRALRQNEEVIITEIKASNDFGGEFSFSLKSKDLMPTENLILDQLSDTAVSIRKIPSHTSMGSALSFNVRTAATGIFERTNIRDLEIPSILALLAILILAGGMAYCIYPVISNFNWRGISAGAYLLALAILIVPSGEKICNLILVSAIVTGLIKVIRGKKPLIWMKKNRRLLLLSFSIIAIYLIAFLITGSDPSTVKLIKIKYGLPIALLAIAINTNSKKEIRIQYLALVTGVIVSVVIHFGWTIMFIDTIELKLRFFSNPRYYLESAIFSRIHHSYLSVLYLAALATIYLKKDLITLHKKEAIIFGLLILTGLLFAFSRAAILSLALILIYYAVNWVFVLRNININRIVRFVAAAVLSISLLAIVFSNFNIDSLSNSAPIEGLSTRMEIWDNATELIKQKPITGWGPGSFKDALKQSNLSSSLNSNTWSVLNTHNQFLETSGMFGLLVSVGLAWFLLFPTGLTLQHSKYSEFLITTAIIFITGFFFESFLNRNLGILIFGLSYGLLIKLKHFYDS